MKKNYNKESDEGFFFEVVVQYLQKLHQLHNDLPERKKTIELKKLVANLHDKTEYAIPIRNLKEALNYGSAF